MSYHAPSSLRTAENRRKAKFSLKVFARRLEAIGVPGTIGNAGDFSRRDCLLSQPTQDLVLDYLAEHLFKKWEEADPRCDRAAAARLRFDEAEALCRETNLRFSPVYRHHGGFQTVIHTARVYLEDLLGSSRGKSDSQLRDELLRAAYSHVNFGPGASTRLPRAKGDKAYKYSGTPEVTTKCAFLARSLMRLSPIWTQIAHSGNDLVAKAQGNRVVTVPKNYKTDRTIAIEPDMNMYVQKGLGGFIRTRLKGVGIDLDDQTINQKLAYAGSIDGSLATIDLSMASDTVSRQVVKSLFPSHIVDFIEETRSDCGVHSDGTVTYYQKVSSMGNGYTFELESALFWALTKAVIFLDGTTDHRMSVYGDDIICPTPVVPRLFEVLDYCGFKVNPEKSFWTGSFRESCGKHYHNGFDVTPFYIKRTPTKWSEVVLLHNQLWRWRDRVAEQLTQIQWDTLTSILLEMRNMCPASYRKLRIPDNFGDGGFVGYLSEIVIVRKGKKYRDFDVVMIPSFSEIASHDESCDAPGLLIKSLLRLENGIPRKTESHKFVQHIEQLIKVKDGLSVYPTTQLKQVTSGALKIPIPVFKSLVDSNAYYTHFLTQSQEIHHA